MTNPDDPYYRWVFLDHHRGWRLVRIENQKPTNDTKGNTEMNDTKQTEEEIDPFQLVGELLRMLSELPPIEDGEDWYDYDDETPPDLPRLAKLLHQHLQAFAKGKKDLLDSMAFIYSPSGNEPVRVTHVIDAAVTCLHRLRKIDEAMPAVESGYLTQASFWKRMGELESIPDTIEELREEAQKYQQEIRNKNKAIELLTSQNKSYQREVNQLTVSDDTSRKELQELRKNRYGIEKMREELEKTARQERAKTYHFAYHNEQLRKDNERLRGLVEQYEQEKKDTVGAIQAAVAKEIVRLREAP